MTTKITGDNITDGSVTTDDLSAAAKSSGDTQGNTFNIGVLGFKIAVNEGLTIYNLVDGVVDEFHDESGIDTSESANQFYDSSTDFYANQINQPVEMFLGTNSCLLYTSDAADE